MKQVCKKLLSVLLALVLVVSLLPIGAFAADEGFPQKPAYDHYVPIGTSITGGYGLNHSNRNSAVGSFGNGAYGRLLYDYFGISSRYDGALLGTRGYEFRLVFEDELDVKDGFTEGWANAKCGNGKQHLKSIAPEYKANIAKADLITIELGSNDLLSYLIYQLTTYIEEQAEGTSSEQQIGSMIESLRGESEGDIFTGLMAISSEYGMFFQLLPQLLADQRTAINDFQTDFEAILNDIETIKETTAGSVPYEDTQIVVLNVYNPFHYLMEHEVTNDANGSGTIRELLLSTGDVLHLPTTIMTMIVDMLTSPLVNSVNSFLSGGCSRVNDDNYLLVDVTNIDLTGSADGTHPDFAGHAYIAEHIETALMNQYRQRNGIACTHDHTTIRGASVPTERRDGSTGSVVCLDCGEVLKESETLTYADYLKQRPVDPETDPDIGSGYPDVPYSVLAFTSDVHNQSNNTSANRLKNWIVKTQENEGALDFLGFCGDTADGTGAANGDAYWNLASKVFDVVKESDVPYYAFTTGNHEQQHGNYGYAGEGTTHDAAKNMLRNAAATVKDDAPYAVYCFGAAPVNNSTDYKFIDEEIDLLEDYLKSVPTDTPVFVLSHYPLHNSGGRTIQNVNKVIEMLNQYPNVIFVWGHNHTNANNQEKHYDQVFTGKIDSTPITFTYASAGCMSDSEYSSGSSSVKGKGLIATVSAEKEVTLVYVDANGSELGTAVTVDLTATPAEPQFAALIEGPYTYQKVATPISGHQYLILNAATNVALNTVLCPGYVNNSNYTYNGFKGAAVTLTGESVTAGVTEDMVWKFESSGNGFTIKNVLTGNYLNATYAGSPATGTVKCDGTSDIWTLSRSVLTSTNANKKFAFDTENTISPKPYTGEPDFFTVRSSGTNVAFYEVVGEPVKEAEPVAPAALGQKYIIVSQGFALTNTVNSGYTNTDNYSYSGFDGTPLVMSARKLTSYISDDMVWELVAEGNGYYIKKGELYLSSTYNSSGNHKGGTLVLGENKELWSFEGSLLKGSKSGKYLTWDMLDSSKITVGDSQLFTVRSQGNATAVTFMDVTDLLETQGEDRGACIGLSKIGDNTYFLAVNGQAVGVQNGLLTAVSIPEDWTTLDKAFTWNIAASDSETWTIRNALTKQYLGVYITGGQSGVTGSVVLSDVPYNWQYNNGFYALISSSGILGITMNLNYYLTVNDSFVSLSDVAVGNGVGLYRMYPAHRYVRTAHDGLIVYECAHCHQKYVEECPGHVYENGRCIYCDALDPAYVPQCVGKVTVALSAGTLFLSLDDQEMGEFTFARSGNGWSLQNAAGQYLTLSNGTLSTADTPFAWTFADDCFSATVSTSGGWGMSWGGNRITTYYLSVINGQLSVSTSATHGKAAFTKMVENMTHTFGDWVVYNGQHGHVCSVCGAVTDLADHVDADLDHQCDVCFTMLFVYGDANDDSLVDTDDLVKIKKYLAGLLTAEDCSAGADANADGVVDTSDLVALKKYLAGLVDALGKQYQVVSK